jgi:hypothetical protein
METCVITSSPELFCFAVEICTRKSSQESSQLQGDWSSEMRRWLQLSKEQIKGKGYEKTFTTDM